MIIMCKESFFTKVLGLIGAIFGIFIAITLLGFIYLVELIVWLLPWLIIAAAIIGTLFVTGHLG